MEWMAKKPNEDNCNMYIIDICNYMTVVALEVSHTFIFVRLIWLKAKRSWVHRVGKLWVKNRRCTCKQLESEFARNILDYSSETKLIVKSFWVYWGQTTLCLHGLLSLTIGSFAYLLCSPPKILWEDEAILTSVLFKQMETWKTRLELEIWGMSGNKYPTTATLSRHP